MDEPENLRGRLPPNVASGLSEAWAAGTPVRVVVEEIGLRHPEVGPRLAELLSPYKPLELSTDLDDDT
jgi:hypothetical protein